MKNIKAAILVIVLAFCGMGAYAQSLEFTPVQKGYALDAPVDTARIAKCIKLALLRCDWVIDSIEPDGIKAHFVKGNGLIRADIKVFYTKDSYSIAYVDSKNLDVDLEDGYIHRSYVRWINNLNKSIYSKYLAE